MRWTACAPTSKMTSSPERIGASERDIRRSMTTWASNRIEPMKPPGSPDTNQLGGTAGNLDAEKANVEGTVKSVSISRLA